MVLVGVSAVSQFTRCCFAPEIGWDSLPLLGKKEERECSLSLWSVGEHGGLSEAFLTKIWMRHQGQERVI